MNKTWFFSLCGLVTSLQFYYTFVTRRGGHHHITIIPTPVCNQGEVGINTSQSFLLLFVTRARWASVHHNHPYSCLYPGWGGHQNTTIIHTPVCNQGKVGTITSQSFILLFVPGRGGHQNTTIIHTLFVTRARWAPSHHNHSYSCL